LKNSTGKKFNLCIGNTAVITVTINTTVIKSYSAQNIVTISKGTHLVSMRMLGTNPNNFGIIVHAVNLQQLIPIYVQNVTIVLNYSIILPEIGTVNVMHTIY
jgi:hypothetical protein